MSTLRRQNVQWALVALALVSSVAIGCKGKKGTGGGGTTPTPGPSSTPTPGPTVAPRSDLTPACRALTNGTGGGSCQEPGTRSFESNVRAAVEFVKTFRPENYRPNSGTVGDIQVFYTDLMNALNDQNICGVATGFGADGGALFVRNANNNSEEYQIIGYRGVLDIQAKKSCTPAQSFPPAFQREKPKDPYQDYDPTCNPPTHYDPFASEPPCVDGNTVTSAHKAALVASIKELAQTTTGLVDPTVTNGGPYFYKILNRVAYLQKLTDIMRSKGHCVLIHSYEELWIKSPTGGFHEIFDIRTGEGEGYVWDKFGAQCSPSIF